MPRGRKSLFREYMIEEGEKLAALGLTMEEIAEFWNVKRNVLYRWSRKYPEFEYTLKKGKLKADTKVTESLYKRAIGYEYDEIHTKEIIIGEGEEAKKAIIKDKIITKQISPDVTAQIYWLQNRRPDLWKDRRIHEHTGTVKHTMTMEAFRESKEKYDKEREGELEFSIN